MFCCVITVLLAVFGSYAAGRMLLHAAGTWRAANRCRLSPTVVGVGAAGVLTSSAHANVASARGWRASSLERPNAGNQQNGKTWATTGVDRSAVPQLQRIYRTLFNARPKLRADFAAKGYIGDD